MTAVQQAIQQQQQQSDWTNSSTTACPHASIMQQQHQSYFIQAAASRNVAARVFMTQHSGQPGETDISLQSPTYLRILSPTYNIQEPPINDLVTTASCLPACRCPCCHLLSSPVLSDTYLPPPVHWPSLPINPPYVLQPLSTLPPTFQPHSPSCARPEAPEGAGLGRERRPDRNRGPFPLPHLPRRPWYP